MATLKIDFYPTPAALVSENREERPSRRPQRPGVDAELVERARRGDAAAQEALVRQLTPRLMRLALRLGCDERTSEEIVGETLCRGIIRLKRLRDGNSAAPWFRSILLNIWRDHLRRRRRGRELFLEDLPNEPASLPALDPVAAASTAELRERAAHAVASLSPAQRAVLALHIDEGLTVAEIASALGTTAARVKANLWHGRKRLRRLLGGPVGRESPREEP